MAWTFVLQWSVAPASSITSAKPPALSADRRALMTSRERVNLALNHAEPDRIPIDLGGTVVTSIALSTYEKTRAGRRIRV